MAVAAPCAAAQKLAPRYVEASETYFVPETQSLADAKVQAARNARIKAMADEFGTLIALQSSTVIEGGRAEVTARGMSEVRGQWLGDTRAPEFRPAWDDRLGCLVLNVTVRGRACETPPATADLSLTVLRERPGQGAAVESTEFADGDNLFLRFRSGRSGYVAVFLLDDDGGVHTLLPYTRDTSTGAVAVERGRTYTFFSRADAPADLRPYTDRYRLRASVPREYNRLCLVFSPDLFTGSVGEQDGGTLRPRFQDYDTFDRWLFDLRCRDPRTGVIFTDITITKQPELP